MILPREPQPGEKLNATWGRDVVKCLRQLRPVGGPGMKVTCGPNGSTFASTAKGVGGSTAVVSGDDDTLYPFRLGVGVEEISGSTGVRYHKVAITPAVDINGVGYEVLNEAVDDDAKLGGLPLPKTGSNLPWIWLKDADFNDVTQEAASGATGETLNVWLHVDKENRKCVLSNSQAVNVPSGTTFQSDDQLRIGLFGSIANVSKPDVKGQYFIGAIAWNEGSTAESVNYPFKLKVAPPGPACYWPLTIVDNMVCEYDNGVHDTNWVYVAFDPSVSSHNIYAYIKPWQDSPLDNKPHMFLTTSESTPSGYKEGYRIYVGKATLVNSVWTIVEQFSVGAQYIRIEQGGGGETSIHPWKIRWVEDSSATTYGGRIEVFIPSHPVLVNGRDVCRVSNQNTWYDVGEPDSARPYIWLHYGFNGGSMFCTITYEHDAEDSYLSDHPTACTRSDLPYYFSGILYNSGYPNRTLTGKVSNIRKCFLIGRADLRNLPTFSCEEYLYDRINDQVFSDEQMNPSSLSS